jgi:hemerythrin-like domain-containing protein
MEHIMVDAFRADTRDMFAMHTVLRREFGLMPKLVRGVADGDEARVALVAAHVTLLVTVFTGHHAGEDKHIWPRLRERGTSEMAFLAGVMEEQHEVIDRALSRVEVALAAWRAGRGAHARDALADAIERLSAATGAHLTLEETRVVPLIERYLTPSEYCLLASEATAALPPDLLPVVVGMFRYEADPEVSDLVIAQMPPEIQPLLRKLADNAYAVYAYELYGTPTPPRAASREP